MNYLAFENTSGSVTKTVADVAKTFGIVAPKVLASFATLCLCVLSSTFANAQTNQPNIVLFLVDDMGLMDTSVPMLRPELGPPPDHRLYFSVEEQPTD